jgi:hypothetical protein
MTRIGSLMLCATLGSTLLACGSNNSSSSKSAVESLPGDNAVSGWTVDTEANKGGTAQPMTAHTWMGTEDSVVGLIDGHADYWSQSSATLKLFVWQNYKNSSLPTLSGDQASIVLYVLQMASADQASEFYDWLVVRQGTDYTSPNNWKATDPTLGTKSRIEDTNTRWWVNLCKDEFYIEVAMDPSFGPDFVASNPDLKKEALRFAEEVARRF